MKIELECTDPEKVKAENKKIEKISQFMQSAVEVVFPGAVLLVVKQGKIVYHEAFGFSQLLPERKIMRKDTLFDLASLTKSLATSIIVMKLVEEGSISLKEKASSVIKEFRNSEKDEIRIWHLLTHTSGLPAWEPLYRGHKGREIIEASINAFLHGKPGERFVYSDLGYIVLMEIAERVTGKSFNKLFNEFVVEPLELKNTMFNPPSELKDNVAATEDCKWRGKLLVGEVHDENAYALGGVSGHAGLFSNALEIAKIAQMLLNKGSYGEKEILSEESVETMTKDWISYIGGGYGLGWVINDTNEPCSAGELMSREAFGHTGFTGTSVWVDPKKELIVVLLTNRVHPSRSNNLIIEFRPKIHNLIVASF
ncbi:MAG: serine hydrolase [Thermoproteota archaeon]|nr:serine hydrolase [Candidatus Brockarchaeota archaeon]